MPSDQTVPITLSLLLRVGRDIQECVSARTLHSLPSLNVSDEQWHQLHALCLLSQKAKCRGLYVAAAEVDWQIRAAAQSLIRPMQDFCDRLDQLASQGSHTSTCREIYDDLVHLAEEFDDVQIDRRNQMLTVRTEPIELEGIDLGPFDIALHWSDIGRGHKPYRVLAVDPQKSARDTSVTHPHVQSDQLCEGDGKQPIARALERGELFEFFVLVRQVLRTYHSGSAYQQLEDWFDDGSEECTDCGCCLDEYERNSCDRCSDIVCNDCCDSCGVCDHYFCQQCGDTCQSCDERVCLDCSEVSADQKYRRCRDCIEEEAENTTNTEETDASTTDTEETAAEAPPADAPVPAGRLGQALVPA